MKKGMILLTVMVLTLACVSAFAEVVRLPDSKYRLTLPDGMEYDGPGKDADDARFVWLSEPEGLEIHFFCYDNSAGVTLEAMAEVLREKNEAVEIRRISGIDMIVYQVTDPDDPPAEGMKCIGYVLADGARIQEICFWYATQKAADRTAEIIVSITNKE